MTIRAATPEDVGDARAPLARVRARGAAAAPRRPRPGARARARSARSSTPGLAFVAEDETGAVGFALARRTGSRLGRLTDLYVVPDARRGGVAAALVHAVVEALAAQGVEHLDLEVLAVERRRARRVSPLGLRRGRRRARRAGAPRSASGSRRAGTPSRSPRSTCRPTPSATSSAPPAPSRRGSARRGSTRRRAAQRLGGRLRRGDRRRPDRARPVRPRALLAHGRRGRRALARGRRGRADGRARPGRDRGRVPLGPRVLRRRWRPAT